MPAQVRGRRDRRLLTGFAAGVALSALLIAILITGGKLRWVTRGPGVDGASITLPGEVAGLADYLAAYRAELGHTPGQLATEAEVLQRTYRTTADAYRDAYGGAGVAVRRYADPDLALVLTVVAVRAGSGPLVAGILDHPADLGLLVQPKEVVVMTGVSCLIRRYLHGPGGDLNPTNQLTDECQLGDGRTATVWVFAEGADTSAEQQLVVRATAAAFRVVTSA